MENTIKILKVLKASTSSDVLVENEGCNNDTVRPAYKTAAKNPLEVDLVLQRIFEFLPLQDIKQCRLVCQLWYRVSAPCSRRLSRVSFGCPSLPLTATKYFASFSDLFNNSGTQIPYTAFGMKKINRKLWTESYLRKYFETWGNTCDDLKIDRMRIKNFKNIVYDMSTFFAGLHLTALTINCPEYNYEISFSTDKIVQVKYLYLHRCSINLVPGILIYPIEIDLKECRFLFPEEDYRMPLNHFIDFGNMKSFTIHHDCYRNNSQCVNLDLAGNETLETLDVSQVSIQNWEKSKWKINKCVFAHRSDYIINGDSLIEIKELEIEKMQIEFIPYSLEKLTISDINERPTIRLPPVSRPSLKHLKLSGQFIAYSLKRFKKCPNLVTLEISLSYSPGLPLVHIPESVRNIRMNGYLLFWVTGSGSKDLEKLVLAELCTFPNDSLSKLNAKDIVLKLGETNHCTRNFIIDAKYFRKYLQTKRRTVAVGPFDWNLENYEDSDFAKIVNEKSEYYLFTKNRGRGIEKTEFDKLMEL